MRIHGQRVPERTRTIEIAAGDGEPLVVVVRPLPLGFQSRLREHGVEPPLPPTRVARDSDGKPLRDQRGHALLISDEFDRDYQAALERYHQRVAVLAVAEALKADPHVEWDAPPPGADWTAYADALYQELAEAGWSDGDLVRACDAVCRLSNLLESHVGEARANFSAGRPRPPT